MWNHSFPRPFAGRSPVSRGPNCTRLPCQGGLTLQRCNIPQKLLSKYPHPDKSVSSHCCDKRILGGEISVNSFRGTSWLIQPKCLPPSQLFLSLLPALPVQRIWRSRLLLLRSSRHIVGPAVISAWKGADRGAAP